MPNEIFNLAAFDQRPNVVSFFKKWTNLGIFLFIVVLST